MKKLEKLFSEKTKVSCKWVAIMDYTRHDRGIIITAFRTRCFEKNEIHEFIACSNTSLPDKPIDKVAYLGFGEIIQGGVVEVGDVMYSGKNPIGTIMGFDETHMPNHYNIIIKTDNPLSGFALKIKLSDVFSIGR
jgi:hypothetical protein